MVTADGRGNNSDRAHTGERAGDPELGEDRGAIGLAEVQFNVGGDDVTTLEPAPGGDTGADTFDTDSYYETRAQREARAASGLHPGRYRAFDLSLLRFGVRPFLMVTDALAYFAAAAVIGHLTNSTLIVFALVVVLYAADGLYRSRLTMSVLDDLPALAGRGIGAAALVTAAGFVLDKTQVSADLLYTSFVFAGLVVVAGGIGANVVVGDGDGVLGEGVRIVVVGVGHTLPYAEQLSAAKAVLETPRAPTVRPEATVSAAAVETSRLVVMIRRCMRNPHLVSLLRSVTDPRQSCKSRHALEASRLIRQRGESCAGSGDRAYISPVRTEVTVRDKERARTVAIGVAAGPGGCGGVTQC